MESDSAWHITNLIVLSHNESMANELSTILCGTNDQLMFVLFPDLFLTHNDEESAMENDGMIDFSQQIAVIV